MSEGAILAAPSRHGPFLDLANGNLLGASIPKADLPPRNLDDRHHDATVVLCKTRKGKYEINLPLIELDVPDDSPNFRFIEDYWYWFWNWR